MFLADVVGSVVTPVAVPFLGGRVQLLVRPLDAEGKSAGRVRVALDLVGAGPGDRVLVMDEGNSGRQLCDAPEAPVKTVVVGVVDSVTVDGAVRYRHEDRPPLERLERNGGRAR
jgi:ethanolamine utilization protein EutN